jgi:hypothetical protein
MGTNSSTERDSVLNNFKAIGELSILRWADLLTFFTDGIRFEKDFPGWAIGATLEMGRSLDGCDSGRMRRARAAQPLYPAD